VTIFGGVLFRQQKKFLFKSISERGHLFFVVEDFSRVVNTVAFSKWRLNPWRPPFVKMPVFMSGTPEDKEKQCLGDYL